MAEAVVTREHPRLRFHPSWLAIVLAIGGAALFIIAFFQPRWEFVLLAPQYPQGLTLLISLRGMSGDVHEIDLLNHYIGMKPLEDAAPTERHLAMYGIALLCLAIITIAVIGGRRLNRFVAVLAALLPLVFLADSFYWLYKFGHELDPHAPLHMQAFTPHLAGHGMIGQFETFARPMVGFWIALVGVALVIASAILRPPPQRQRSSSRQETNLADRGNPQPDV